MKKLRKNEAVDSKGRIWDKASIQKLLSQSDQAVIHGLLKIYENQTNDEKIDEETKYLNGIGFTGCDAKILTNYVEFYQKRKYLTPKQIAVARKKMMKYTTQLIQFIQVENRTLNAHVTNKLKFDINQTHIHF